MNDELVMNLMAQAEEFLNNIPDDEELGQAAMDFISDYPLYASQSNITYREAIAIAILLGMES